jgi:ABC-type glutathione transport system ATPase component
MTVEQALSEPLAIHRLAAPAGRRRAVEELLAAVGLPAAYRARLPRQLSGGERQRVGIARALAVQPQALVCDEPIASLDVSIGAQILELLRRLCDERRLALIFISHDIRAVMSLCHRVAIMQRGRLIQIPGTEVLLAGRADPYAQRLLRAASLDLDTPDV